MRGADFGKRIAVAAFAAGIMLLALCLALPCRALALDESTSLADREVWFTYGCTDCLGKTVYIDKEQIGTLGPGYYGVDMMMCDTDHVVHVGGDGVTADNVTYKSLKPEVLQVDSAGNVTLMNTGKAEIQATIAADDQYNEATVYLGITVDRHDGWISDEPVHYEDRSPFMGLDLDTSDGSHQLVVPLRPGARLSYESFNPAVACVDQNGLVTPVSAGHTTICFTVEGGKYRSGYFYEGITVTGEDLRSEQEITGDLGPFTIDYHDGLQLDLHAKTDLWFDHVSGDWSSVGQTGFVYFSNTSVTVIKVTAVGTKDYKPAEVLIYITARDYAAEEAARQAEEAIRQAAEADLRADAAAKQLREIQRAQAKALKKPTLKVKALKGKKIKITWGHVENADGYVVYVKYPGKKAYVQAVTRNATVKSVTHKGLSKRKTYKYKVAAYKIVNGKVYYSPFSKVRKAKVK